MPEVAATRAAGLGREYRVGLFAMMLAVAGLPLYIHLPRFAVSELGLSLSVVGVLLIAVRIFDFVQDPLIGIAVDRFNGHRALMSALACGGLAAGFLMLFAMPAPFAPLIWLAAGLIVVFSAYSLGMILLYSQTAALAGRRPEAILRLSSFREAGMLAGIVAAALLPALLAGPRNGYAAFGSVAAVFALFVWLATRSLWTADSPRETPLRLADLARIGALPVLVLAFVNALPVAITSTLFLFFVEDRLQLAPMAGLFLVLFFAAAGLSVPLWNLAIRKWGLRRVLVGAMSLAIATFIWAALLRDGDALPFAAVCVLSGAALGADMIILPAILASRLASAGYRAGSAFGLWSFATKMTLALAAAIVLPTLDFAGFTAGGENPASALAALTVAYAVLPCVLKLIAIRVVLGLPDEVFA